MTGYQEVLSDPSYCGQILTFTYPLIGNYGVNDEDWESDRLRAQGMVCRDMCEVPSNWRSTGHAARPAASRAACRASRGIDTRALTRHLRDRGTMRGCLSTLEHERRRAGREGAQEPAHGGARARRPGDLRRALLVERRTARSRREPAADRERPLVVVLRLRRQVQHPAPAARRGLPRARACPRARAPPTCSRWSPTACCCRTAPAIPSRSTSRSPPRASCRTKLPDARHLPRPPAARARVRCAHVQAQVRPPRRESPGDRPAHRRGRGHEPEPRLHGGRRHAARGRVRAHALQRQRPARSRAWCTARCPCCRCQYHPEASPGPHDSRAVVPRVRRLGARSAAAARARRRRAALGGQRADAAPHRHQEDPRPRRRPDRHRAGVRVRLLGHAGLPRAASRSASRSCC